MSLNVMEACRSPDGGRLTLPATPFRTGCLSGKSLVRSSVRRGLDLRLGNDWRN
jgi:hypothetical protein